MSESESRTEIVLELAEQFLERYRRGERPSLKDFVDRYPELADEIREVFPAMAMMEKIALADESIEGRTKGAGNASAAAPLEQLGDYRIIREVGHGGMGIVYEAEQVSLGRHVALKVLPQKLLLGDKQKQRFEREAKAAAKLHHTNIVPVFGVGDKDGMPYYVMQFIQGLGLDQVLTELQQLPIPGAASQSIPIEGELRVSLSDVSAANMARSLLTGDFAATRSGPHEDGKGESLILPQDAARRTGTVTPKSDQCQAAPKDKTTGKLSETSSVSASSVMAPGQSASAKRTNKKQNYWQSVANIGVQVADALDYAHQQGVLHRDIKPSNLLLDTRGTVWVTDFGLAKTDDQQNLTHTGDILGTLRYMSPEAFEGRSDPRSDVYSLGLTIYELLALRPAFDERDRHRLIKKVTTEVPPRLDRVNAGIPRDLVTIVHKAIDKDPAQRYQSSDELGADLQRFVDDEPIKARRLKARERAWRWCRHNPLVAGLAAALLLLLLSSTIGSLLAAGYYDRLATREAQTAQDERDARLEATANLQEAERQKLRAEANFAKARAAVDDYLTRVSESQLVKVPGLQPLRRELLQSALGFYEAFIKEHGSSPDLQAELAATHLRVARIAGELGNQTSAQKSFDRAIAGYEAALHAQPKNRELKFGLADCWSSMALMYFNSDHKKALPAFAKAMEIQEELLQMDPTSEVYKAGLAQTYNGLACMQMDDRNASSIMQLLQRCVELRQELVLAHPDSPVLQHALAECLGNVGVELSKEGHMRESLAIYERALVYARAAFERMPHLIEYGLDVGIDYANLANSHSALGQAQQALNFTKQRVDHWTSFAEANPAAPIVQRNLLVALLDLGLLQARSMEIDGALLTARKIAALIPSMSRREASDHFLIAQSHMQYAALADLCKDRLTTEEDKYRLRQPELAIQDLGKAVAAGYSDLGNLEHNDWFTPLKTRRDYQELVKQVVANVTANAAVVESSASLPRTAAEREPGRPGAVAHQPFAPKLGQLEADLALTHYATALTQIEREQLADAEKSLNQACSIFEALDKKDASHVGYGPYLGSIYVARGMLDWRAGRFGEGKRQWDKGIAYLEKAKRNEPNNSLVTAQLGDSYARVGVMWALTGCWEESANSWQKALDLTPTEHWRACQLAIVLSLTGDTVRYHAICEKMLARAAGTQMPAIAEQTARVCLLLPTDKEQLRLATALANRAVGFIGQVGGNAPFILLLQGVMEYRNGKYGAAVTVLQEISAQYTNWEDRWDLQDSRKAVLAMALFRDGHKEEARTTLNNLMSRRGHLQSVYCIVPPKGWDLFSGLIGLALLKEAHQLIVGEPMNEPLTTMLRAHVYKSIGANDKAAKALSKFTRPRQESADEMVAWATALARIGLTEDALTEFKQALQIDPKCSRAWLQRGEMFAYQRRWKEAVPDVTRYLENVHEGDEVFKLAPLLLQAGDLDGYHRHCQVLVARFGATNDPLLAERAAKACLILPPLDSYKEGALYLADQALALDKGDELQPYILFAKSLAEYRRGNYREAVAIYDHSVERPRAAMWSLRIQNEFVHSMALAHLDDPEGARAALTRSARLLKSESPRFEQPGLDVSWHDWLICRLLYAEAKQVVESKAND